jgi:hypothetical protein
MSRFGENFGWSIRTQSCLVKLDVQNMDQLAALTPDDIVEGGGNTKVVAEIKEFLGVNPTGGETHQSGGKENKKDLAAQNIFLHIEIQKLLLSVRTQNVLENMRIRYVGELIQISPSSFLRQPNFGRRSLKEIEIVVSHFCLRLGTQVSNWSPEEAVKWNGDNRSEANAIIESFHQKTSGVEISTATSLEGELRSIVANFATPSNINLIISLWGWSGRGRRTLEAVAQDPEVTGRSRGLTRERVRQIASKVEKKLQRITPSTPILDGALVWISEHCPNSESQVTKGLKIEGISEIEFDLSGLFHAARTLGREPLISSREVDGIRYVFAKDHWPHLEKLVHTARSLTSKRGCVNFEFLCDLVELNDTATRGCAQHLVNNHPELVWLDESHEWIRHLGSVRNRLTNLIEKIFAVTSKIHISELRSAVRRHHRVEAVPPIMILKAFCESHDFLKVNENFVETRSGVTLIPHFGTMETILTTVLKENNSVMARPLLEKECIDRGMNPNSFYLMLSYSPLIQKLARGVYALVGAEIAPGLVENIAPDYGQKKKRLMDYGWSDAGEPWLVVETSDSMLRAGVLPVPAGLKKTLIGDWRVSGSGDRTVRSTTIVVNESGLRNIAPIFRRLGVESGDMIGLTFDLNSRHSYLIVGGTEIAERMQAGDFRLWHSGPDARLDEFGEDEHQ